MASYLEEDKYIKDPNQSDDLKRYNTVEIIETGGGNFGIALEEYAPSELPTVSVLTITYNRDYIFDIAIRNWSKFIYPKDKIEWVIVDDSTKSSSIKTMLPNDDRISYIRLDSKIPTVGAKRNAGIELCSNEIIAFMDDDDYYFPDSILNRVRVLMMYKKELVGSVSLNCVNLVDNTSFLTDGGIFTFKNGDKAIICAEASLCFYKTFWEKQKFNQIVFCEEIIDFTRNRTDSFINLHGSYVMVAFSHGSNMSDRCLVESINVHNFLDELDMNTVNFIEELRLKILMQQDSNKQALEFYKKMISKGLGTSAIYKKINALPKEVQKSPIIKELRNQNPLYKTAPPRSVSILYFYLGYNTAVQLLDRKNPDVHALEIYELARLLSYRNYNVVLYMYTDDEFTIDNFKVKPYWKYSSNDACECTIVYRDLGILTEKINTKKLYFLSTDYITDIKNGSLYKKCDEIWVDNINSKLMLHNKFDYPLENIYIFSLLDLPKQSENIKNKETNALTVFIGLTVEELNVLKGRFNKIYAKKRDYSTDDSIVKYIDNLYAVNTEYMINDLKHISLLYAKHSNSKLCLINNFSDPIDVNLDYSELPLNFLNVSKTNMVIERLFPYQRAGAK